MKFYVLWGKGRGEEREEEGERKEGGVGEEGGRKEGGGEWGEEGEMRDETVYMVLADFPHPSGSHGGAGRVFMRLQGLELGPPRLPALPLSPEDAKNLESDLRDIGFFEWA